MPYRTMKLYSSAYSKARRWLTATVLIEIVLVASGQVAFAQPGTDRAGLLGSSPLKSRSYAPPGATARFTRLPGEQTGIGFVHHWDYDNPHKNVIDNAMAGGGVAIGDADGDGLPDIYLTSPAGGSRLYKNLGGLRFEDITEQSGLADDHWAGGAGFVDIDNDGDLDLSVCGYLTPNRLYVNKGDGTFTEQAAAAGLDFTGASVMMAFADYDGDGDMDAYLVTNRVPPPPNTQVPMWLRDGKPTVGKGYEEYAQFLTLPDGRAGLVRAGQADHLYRNNGDGTFTDVTDEAGIAGYWQGLSAIWWDYNADGRPDLYVANDFFGPDALYRNNGDGTFTDVSTEALSHTPWFAMGSDTADINNDGKVDLMVADMAGTTHYRSKLSMGDMADSSWFLTYGEVRQAMHNALYLNTGAGRLMEIAALAGVKNTGWTWAVKFGDLDNDGRVDLFISNGMTRDWFNSDMRNKAAEIGAQPSDPFWLDSPQLRQANMAFRNKGDLAFEDAGSAWGLDEQGVGFGVAYADLDRDGDLDMVINNFEEPPSVYRNDSSDGQSLLLRLRGVESNRFGIGAKATIRTPDGLMVRYLTQSQGFMSANDPVMHIGLGKQAYVDSLTIDWPSGRRQVFNKLETGRIYTVTEPALSATHAPTSTPKLFKHAENLSHITHHETPYDDFARQPLLPNKLSQLGPGMAWADVDADGDDDLFVGGAAGQAGTLQIRQDDGSFLPMATPVFEGDKAAEDMAPLFFDADGDRDMDLYVVSGGVEAEAGDSVFLDRLYLNDGTGDFTHAPHGTLPDLHDSGSAVVAADFDRDGDLDLFVGSRSIPSQYPVAPTSRLLRNEGDKFTDATESLAPGLVRSGMVTAALWSDVDDDGWVDLLVAHDWGPVKVFRNRQGKLEDVTQDAGLAELLGWWNGLAAADIDNDGDIDFLATNVGLNTKYHANPDHPVFIYYGDFDGNGKSAIIEADYEDSKLFPVRGKSCSTNAIPSLGEKLPTFHDFASATLSDIYTPTKLEQAYRVAVNTLESGVFINDGKGHFTFRSLPRLAQASPGFGCVLTDVDADGFPDVYMVQNFFNPQPETTRMDAGVSLLLLGKGDGTFESVSPDRSGLIVPGDAKALTLVDLNNDGRQDFVVTVNSANVQVFENRLEDRGRSYTVRLTGPTGNPDAVGARVTLQLSDGSTRTAEVYAGGGYLSQSRPVLLFGLGNIATVSTVQIRCPDGRYVEYDNPANANVTGDQSVTFECADPRRRRSLTDSLKGK